MAVYDGRVSCPTAAPAAATTARSVSTTRSASRGLTTDGYINVMVLTNFILCPCLQLAQVNQRLYRVSEVDINNK